MAKQSQRGRSARSGRFVKKTYALSHPATTTIETIKVGPTKKRRS